MVNYQTIAALVNQIPVDTWDVLRKIRERRPFLQRRVKRAPDWGFGHYAGVSRRGSFIGSLIGDRGSGGSCCCNSRLLQSINSESIMAGEFEQKSR